jgi:hypothetical protein
MDATISQNPSDFQQVRQLQWWSPSLSTHGRAMPCVIASPVPEIPHVDSGT